MREEDLGLKVVLLIGTGNVLGLAIFYIAALCGQQDAVRLLQQLIGVL